MTSCSGFKRKALLLIFLFCASQGVAADDQAIQVEVDHARIVKIPQGAQTLVIGNPLIADVTMLKTNQLMVLTGKSFGSTNLIVLDRSGSQVGQSMVTVVPSKGNVVVQRGVHRESLSCHPICARAVDLADDLQYMNNAIAGAKAYDDVTLSMRK